MPSEQLFFVVIIFVAMALTAVVTVRSLWSYLGPNRRAQSSGSDVGPSWFRPLVRS
jgi:hypothetical protein